MSLAFKLTLDNTEYVCDSTQRNKEDSDHVIRTTYQGMRLTVDIPIEAKKKRLEVMAFVERLHEAMKTAAMEQNS